MILINNTIAHIFQGRFGASYDLLTEKKHINKKIFAFNLLKKKKPELLSKFKLKFLFIINVDEIYLKIPLIHKNLPLLILLF